MEPLPAQGLLAGTRQVLRSLGKVQVICVYVAEDADAPLRQKLLLACENAGVEVRPVRTMHELGVACGIEVGAACAGVIAQ